MATWTDPQETLTALSRLALNEGIFTEAITRAEAVRATATPHHPPNAGGWFAWAELTRALRDLIVPLGGAKIDDGGFARCLCPDGRDAIAVLAGDRATGDPNMEPQPKYSKPRVAAQNSIARSQQSLFSQEDLVGPGPRLWFLLVQRYKGVVANELSRPELIDDNGFIAKWAERIIMSPVPVDSTPLPGGVNTEYTPIVDLDVTPNPEPEPEPE